MEPTVPYSPASTPDSYTNYTPPAGPIPTGEPAPGGKKKHGWAHHGMHLLMCAPMLLVVGFLVLTGRAGGSAILSAVGCVVMMGVMMAAMNRGSSSKDSSGHEHEH
jgi:hypothetical protein